MYRHGGKRMLDVVASAVILLVGWPVMVLCALAVRLDSRGPVIFVQERLGRGGRTFRMYKFRTMRVGAEHTGSGVYSGRGDDRVTRVGRILRATSLDELPQMVNILKGDMSFIGPRPPLTYHPWPLGAYTPAQARMFEVRPGLTGWAQVHGRRGVEWNRRIAWNVWYVDHVSLWLDIRILGMTVVTLFDREGNRNTGPTVDISRDREGATEKETATETATETETGRK